MHALTWSPCLVSPGRAAPLAAVTVTARVLASLDGVSVCVWVSESTRLNWMRWYRIDAMIMDGMVQLVYLVSGMR